MVNSWIFFQCPTFQVSLLFYSLKGCCSSQFENHSFTVDMPLLAKISCDIIKNVHSHKTTFRARNTSETVEKTKAHVIFRAPMAAYTQ